MSNNRDLLTEAIADAKAVKETAIANAKAALEESFTPHLKSMLAAKLEEMDKDDENVKESEEIQETEEVVNETEDAVTETEEVAEATEQVDEEINLDEFLAELEVAEGKDKEEVKESEELDEAKEDKLDESEEIDEAAELEVTEADEDEAEEEGEADAEEGEEEEIDLEDMTEDDLKKFIEDVIADMVETGELEPGPDAEADGEMGDDLDMPAMEDEIELEEVEEMKAPTSGEKEEGEMKEEVEEEVKEEIDEVANALAEVEALKSELNEVNLLNAKLLYTNKIFRSKNLTETKKVQVLKAFDKAVTVKEAKVIFETLNEGLVEKTKTVVNEVKGSASKATGTANVAKQPIVESDAMVERFKKLAGII